MYAARERVPAHLLSRGVSNACQGLTLAARERVPAHLLSRGVSNACRGLTLAARERVAALLPSGGISWWSHQLLTASTLIYANGTGITAAADT